LDTDKWGNVIKLTQYGQSRKDKILHFSLNEAKIHYAISTLGSQSGCPVVSDNKTIAIHCGGATGDE
jgi:V8-like Glu-specific endopeptidase